jgi:hypothetical protein
MTDETVDYGPYTTDVNGLLKWINTGQLLRFGRPWSGPFIPIESFDEAVAIAQGDSDEGVSWTEIRDQADASMYEVGLLDTPAWAAYKGAISGLLSQVANRVDAALPDDYRDIIDDVIADLHACARCLAVYGRLDPFHEILWQAYSCGGWPCGCAGTPPELLDTAGRDWELYIFWRGNPTNC